MERYGERATKFILGVKEMSSKWCSNCKMIVTTNSIPSFCCWCGKDLRLENILPKFSTWAEREKIVNELLQAQQIVKENIQLKLFQEV